MNRTAAARRRQAALATPIFSASFREPGQTVTVGVQNIVTVRIDVSTPGPDETMETAMYILGRQHVREMIEALESAEAAMIRQEEALARWNNRKGAAA
jgi:hypothetical protein